MKLTLVISIILVFCLGFIACKKRQKLFKCPKDIVAGLDCRLNQAINEGNKKEINRLLAEGVKAEGLKVAVALGKKDEVENYLKQGKFIKTSLDFYQRYEEKRPEYYTLNPNPKIKNGEVSFFDENELEKELTRYPQYSLLYIAVVNNQKEIAKILIDNGETIEDGVTSIIWRPDMFAPYNGSSLRIAVQKSYKEMVAFLLDNGIKVTNSEDIDGKTVLDYATDKDIKKMLLKHDAKKGSGVRHVFE